MEADLLTIKHLIFDGTYLRRPRGIYDGFNAVLMHGKDDLV